VLKRSLKSTSCAKNLRAETFLLERHPRGVWQGYLRLGGQRLYLCCHKCLIEARVLRNQALSERLGAGGLSRAWKLKRKPVAEPEPEPALEPKASPSASASDKVDAEADARLARSLGIAPLAATTEVAEETKKLLGL
jgi:hypothetical protein